MPYIGAKELKASDIRRFDVTGSTSATHTLTWTAPNEQSLIVTINGVKQHEDAYSVSGTTLTLTSALVSTDKLEVIGINDIGTTITPAQNSVDADKIADDAVTSAKLANALNITSGNSLTIDSGATITNSGTATGFTNVFDVYFQGQLASNQTVSRASNVKVTGMTSNEIDSDSAFDGTTFTVPTGKSGFYIIFAHVYPDFSGVGNDGMSAQAMIFINGSAVFNSTQEGTSSGPDTFNRAPLAITLIKNLSAGDTVELYVNLYDYDGTGDARVNSRDTSLGGFRLS